MEVPKMVWLWPWGHSSVVGAQSDLGALKAFSNFSSSMIWDSWEWGV